MPSILSTIIVTLDEWWLHQTNRAMVQKEKRNVCYIKKTDPDYERMILHQDSKGLMVFHLVGKHLCVSFNLAAKINADYYINHFCLVIFVVCFQSMKKRKGFIIMIALQVIPEKRPSAS